MPCLVKRHNGIIDKVFLPDGKTESRTYKELLEAVENMPDEMQAYVMMSIKPYIGKFINNIEDTSEIALGMYLTLQSKDFTDFFGDWQNESELQNTNEIGEPQIKNIDGVPSFVNQNGKSKSVYNTGQISQSPAEVYRSVKTRKVNNLLSYVKTSMQVLQLRIEDAIRAKSALEYSDLSKEEKVIKTKYYNDLITKTIEQKKVLKDKNNIQYVTLIAQTDMDMVKDILSSKRTKLSDVQIALRATEAWKNTLQILGVNSLEDLVDPVIKDAVRNIISDAQDLEINIKELASQLLIQHSRDGKAARPLTDKDFDPRKGLKDVNWVTSQVRDLSNTGVGLADFLARTISEANSKIAREHNTNNRKIETAGDRIKDHAEIKKNGFKIFFKEQTNTLGVKTLGLRGPYAQSYYDANRVQYKKLNADKVAAGNDREKIKKAYADHNIWLKKNTTIFNSIPFVDEANHTDQDRLKVIDEMKAMGFTASEVNDMINKSVELYQRYLEGSERFKINLEYDIDNGNVIVPAGKTKDQVIYEEVKKWNDEHNPTAFIRQQETYVAGEKRAYKGTYYTLKVPRKIIDGKDSGHYDQDFARIAADPELFRFYKFFKDFIDEQLSYLPQEEIEDLQSNFLPVITSKIATEYGLSSLKETANGIGDWFLNHLTSVDFQRKEKLNPITGKVINDFSPRFINENITVEERSKDMIVMMKLFSDMALVYKHKGQVKDYVDLTNDIIQNTNKTYTEDSTTGDIKIESKSPRHLQAMAESTVNNAFYGKKADQNDKNGGRKFYNAAELLSLGLYKSPEYKKAVELEKQIKALNTKIDTETLTEDELAKLETELYKLRGEYAALGGRQFSFTKSADSLINLTRLSALGFQPFSAFRNVAVGKVNNVIHSIGGEDFNQKELAQSNRIILASTAKYVTWGTVQSETAEKILKYMLDTGTVEGEDSMFVEGIVDKRSTWQEIKKVLPSPFTLMQSTDFHMKSETAIATALHKKIITADGEQISFWDAMTKDLQYNTEKYGEWVAENNNGLTFQEFYNKEMLKMGQLSKKLHGFSGNNLSLAGKDSIWGRLLFLFKTWLPETLMTRFESKRYDDLLERDVQGYYRTTARAFRDQGLGAFKSIYKAVFEAESGDMDPLERANLRKSFAEMVAITTLATLGFVLKSLASGIDDDDEKKRYMLIVNQLILLNRDLTYYVNINSFGDLTKDVVPVIRTIENWQSAMKAVTYYGIGVENDDGTEMYDGERTLLKISKALPALNNINRIQYYQDEMADVR